MLIVLRDPSKPDAALEVDVAHLLAKAGKHAESARGPLVEAAEGTPLAALRDGDKLHVVAPGQPAAIAGLAPAELVARLRDLGLSQGARLDQIHLLADNAGTGGERSFAQRFAEALMSEGFAVLEIKAPRGAIRCNASGKVLIRPAVGEAHPADVRADPDGYYPSSSSLNHYAGPGIKAKHLR
jgi:hypothetical protein